MENDAAKAHKLNKAIVIGIFVLSQVIAFSTSTDTYAARFGGGIGVALIPFLFHVFFVGKITSDKKNLPRVIGIGVVDLLLLCFSFYSMTL